jgi:hypothetical protein
LSVAVVEHFSDPAASAELRRALDAALGIVESPGTQEKRRDRLASAIANCLLWLAPEELLKYPCDCEPVQSALRRAAHEHGWLVFQDRILDAEGGVVAPLARSKPRESEPPGSAEARPSPVPQTGRFGTMSTKDVRTLLVFYKIGLEYEADAHSLSEIGRRFETRDESPYSKGTLYNLCVRAQQVLNERYQSREPFFVAGGVGLSWTGLTPHGLAVWKELGIWLRELGLVP